jgi:hypothetical protein
MKGRWWWGPRLTGVGAVLLGTTLAAQEPPPPDNCRTCHEALTVERLSAPAKRFGADVHAGKGFGCVACHGGDASIAGFNAMDPAKGFLGKPKGMQLLVVCGRCHSDGEFMRRYNPSLRVDQVAEYRTSVHGQRLAQSGDTSVATCVSCHPAHAIKPPTDPLSSVYPLNVPHTCGACHADTVRMTPYGIRTDQLAQYEESIHWEMVSVKGDLSAPVCNDCHGNHGAAPPGVAWVGNVCGQCHAVVEGFFAQSTHARVFSLMGIPGCAVCHGNHAVHAVSDTMLGLGDGAVCSRCHQPDMGGGVTAAAMRTAIDSLAAAYGVADSLLATAEHAGMEVSQAQVDLRGAHSALVQARTVLHTFNLDSVTARVDEGLEVAGSVEVKGRKALSDLQFRRIGLAVSVFIIVLLTVGLILKIRQVESRA